MKLIIGDTIEVKFKGKKAKPYIVMAESCNFLQLRNINIEVDSKGYIPMITVKRIEQ